MVGGQRHDGKTNIQDCRRLRIVDPARRINGAGRVILISMSFVPALRSASVAQQPTPAPRYAYCSKAWRQQLPAAMQATFEDRCEHRPGAVNAGVRK
jgi:hypothetical protein